MRYALAVLIVVASAARAQSSGFSATWIRVVDSAIARPTVAAVGDAAFRVGDMGSGWGTPLTVTQRPDSLIVEYVFFAPYDLQPPVRMAYAANGAESVNDVILSHATTRVRGRATQSADAIVITDVYPSPTGQATEVRRTLTLESPTTLVVEVARGTNRTRTSYTRR